MFKYTFIVSSLIGSVIALYGCGRADIDCYVWGEECKYPENGKRGPEGKPGSDGVVGPAGATGNRGDAGKDGKDGIGSAGKDGIDGVNGINGTNGVDGTNGVNGVDGINGTNGIDGQDGSSCSVQPDPMGALISCTDGSQVVLLNGENGEDAPPTPYTVTEMIDPCLDTPGPDEVLLRLHNGTIIAWYTGLGLSVIGPGNWTTTDSSACQFTVHPNGDVTDEDGNAWNVAL